MAFREMVFDNLIGDLEYRPRRALLFVTLSALALAVWIFASHGHKIDVVPMVFGAGGVALLLKGIFLLRRTSDGLAGSTHSNNLPSFQVVLVGAGLFAFGWVIRRLTPSAHSR